MDKTEASDLLKALEWTVEKQLVKCGYDCGPDYTFALVQTFPGHGLYQLCMVSAKQMGVSPYSMPSAYALPVTSAATGDFMGIQLPVPTESRSILVCPGAPGGDAALEWILKNGVHVWHQSPDVRDECIDMSDIQKVLLEWTVAGCKNADFIEKAMERLSH